MKPKHLVGMAAEEYSVYSEPCDSSGDETSPSPDAAAATLGEEPQLSAQGNQAEK